MNAAFSNEAMRRPDGDGTDARRPAGWAALSSRCLGLGLLGGVAVALVVVAQHIWLWLAAGWGLLPDAFFSRLRPRSFSPWAWG